ncbi:MAG: hypothetical protein NTY05_14455, partial [Rhodocyclales bacterium]|nr:hypothetical protein [Rhodocyclales bacterium]
MFRTLSKKDSTPPAEAPASLPETSLESEWGFRLQAALGNDTALLALLKECSSIEIKVAAVQALNGGESMIPANRLVELDQAWRALDVDLLESDQVAKFADLQARLAERVRNYGDRQRSVSRWSVHARQVLANLSACCARTTDTSQAPHELLVALTSARGEANNTYAQISALMPAPGPDAKILAALGDELSAALHGSALIEARLTILDELQAAMRPPAAEGDKA